MATKTQPDTNTTHHVPVDKSDAGKGAVEGDRPEDTQQGNANAAALDENGLPVDRDRICEDVIGANVDESQG